MENRMLKSNSFRLIHLRSILRCFIALNYLVRNTFTNLPLIDLSQRNLAFSFYEDLLLPELSYLLLFAATPQPQLVEAIKQNWCMLQMVI